VPVTSYSDIWLKICNRSPGLLIYGKLKPVSVYQCPIFVHLGLRRILVLCKQVKMDEDEMLMNAYEIFRALALLPN
jgi:hypothetical protein